LAGIKEVQLALASALRDETAALAPSPAAGPVSGTTVGDTSAKLKAQVARCSEFEGRLRRVHAAVGALESKLARVETSTAALRAKAEARAAAARSRKEAERARDRDLAEHEGP